MKRGIISVLLPIFVLMMANAAITAGQTQKGKDTKDRALTKEEQKTQSEYTCPMHPEVKSTSPGTCPKCKMELVEVKKEIKTTSKQKVKAEYGCPMHPDVQSTSPGTCPKCKMELVEVRKGKQSSMKQKAQVQ